MDEKTSFEIIPSSWEKQPYKYIMDSVKNTPKAKTKLPKQQTLPATEPPPTEKPKPVKSRLQLRVSIEKKYFRIGEAADLIGVEPYVLRYWESEFPSIRPMKTKSGHRVYSRRDLFTFQDIHNLLYVEKFSVKGAKKKLIEMKRAEKKPQPNAPTADPKREQRLKALVTDLKSLIHVAKGSPWSC